VYTWYSYHVIHVVLRECGTMFLHCVVMAS